MTTIEPRPQTLAEQLADARARIAEYHAAGEKEAIAVVHEGLTEWMTSIRDVATDAEVALLDLLPKPEKVGHKWQRPAPLAVDDVTYAAEPRMSSKEWKAGEALTAIVGRYVILDPDTGEVDDKSLVSDLLTVLPAKVTLLVGKPDEDGLRGLGLNPDDFAKPATQTGWKLETKRVTP